MIHDTNERPFLNIIHQHLIQTAARSGRAAIRGDQPHIRGRTEDIKGAAYLYWRDARKKKNHIFPRFVFLDCSPP
ncbi:hypothetical protein Hanom_Chr07g00629591 [Helianthus anomalus]